MIRRSRTWRTAAVLGVASLTLAACGGGEDDAGTDEQAGGGGTGTEAEVPEGDGQLVIGALLPQTGQLAYLGPPQFAGVNLAVEEINEAGGVLGEPVQLIEGDEGDTTTDIASQTVDRLLSQNVDAIIGAAASGVSLTVIDRITGAGVVQFSGSNTGPVFTDYDDSGLYFRTAPSDALQGRVLGNEIIEDGYLDVGIMARDDAYGNGLADTVEQTLEEGGGSVTEKIIYNPAAPNFTAEVGQLAASDPEAIVVIGFEETQKILPELIAQGIGPQNVPLYLVDGNLIDYSAELTPGVLEGTKGTRPGGPDAPDAEAFQDRLLAVNPALEEFTYGREVYDATIMTALAAIAAESDAGEAIASQLVPISKEGEQCSTFADCKELLENGEDIDYQGVSGPVDFSEAGEPQAATIGIYQYGPDNTFENIAYEEGQL